jgi:hypothetical protein
MGKDFWSHVRTYVSPDLRALEREWEIIHRSPDSDGRWEEGLYNAAPSRQLPVVRMEGPRARGNYRLAFTTG